jgi:hypothetical protein
MAADYALVLAIINSDTNPTAALRAFVAQECEAALARAGVIVIPSEQYARLTSDEDA